MQTFRYRFDRHLVNAALTIGLCLIAAPAVATDLALPAVFQKLAPEGAADLTELELVTRDLAEHAVESTVCVEVGVAMGSGVIVSEDGYVLTAAHVTGAPGRDVRIILHDGTRLEGKTLGIHSQADGGLIKITSKGKWSYAPLVPEDEAPQMGDWCLATGHPGGFQPERGTPIRLGRVVQISKSVMRTDCPITEGDSGGPLFDMHGRVIGIHSRITQDVTENFHGPALAFREAWEEMKAERIYPARPPSRFLDLLDVNQDGQITRSELPDGIKRRVFDRLAEELELDADGSLSIDEITEDVLNWQTSLVLDFGGMERGRGEVSEALSPTLFVRGRMMRQTFTAMSQDAGQSIVRVRSGDDSVALGAVVSADGLILTKASELGPTIECRLANGRDVAARLVDVDDENDLALLRVEADDLHPIEWAKSDLVLGRWLITPGGSGRPESVGVVSTTVRRIPRAQAVLGVQVENTAGRPRVEMVMPRGGAAQAGILDGDVITRIAGTRVRSLEELRGALGAFRAGDVVRATIQRGSDEVELEVTLGAEDEVFYRFGISRINGPLSRRRDDFPQAIQHDSTLRPNQCGGPVLDLSGKAVGINVARFDRVSAFLVPYEAFAGFLERHVSKPKDTTSVSAEAPAARADDSAGKR
jgi:serine protease Do